MTPDQRVRFAHILGYICVVVSALNLVLAAVIALKDRSEVGFSLLGSGAGALTLGIILLALAKQRPKSQG